MRGLALMDVHFEYARLTKADLEASVFINCVFKATLAQESRWTAARIVVDGPGTTTLEHANFHEADFDECVIQSTSLEELGVSPHFQGAIFIPGGGEPFRIRIDPRDNEEMPSNGST
jgi:uncharacterized protein YjbI with pentapeptide repeats